jgi:hypothetical protein
MRHPRAFIGRSFRKTRRANGARWSRRRVIMLHTGVRGKDVVSSTRGRDLGSM